MRRSLMPLILVMGMLVACGGQATTVPPSGPATAASVRPASLTPAPSATAAATVKTQAFKGKGDKVVKFTIPEDLAAIAKITNSGGENFVVESLDSSGSTNDLLVNTIGKYAGTRLFDGDAGMHSVAFKIQSTGSWTVTIMGVSSARAWNGRTALKGRGDDVVRVSPPIARLATFQVTHAGAENFAVTTYASDSSNLVVNEIGEFSGEEQFADGTLLVGVEADGAWSITPTP
jgi:hypothetical protein